MSEEIVDKKICRLCDKKTDDGSKNKYGEWICSGCKLAIEKYYEKKRGAK